MSKSTNSPKDKKDYERRAYSRYYVQSGQETEHGMSLYEVITQEGQAFAFYAGNGQGAVDPKLSTGRAVLFTPGMSLEVTGTALQGTSTGKQGYNPAKHIQCKHGDLFLECLDGDIHLEAKNIHINATGGGDDGNIDMSANQNIVRKAPDVSFQGDRMSLLGRSKFSIIAKRFSEVTAAVEQGSNAGDLDLTSIGALGKGLGLGKSGF